MLKYLIFISLVLTLAYGRGELTILHHPESISFKGHERLDESDLKEVYTASLGFSIEHSSAWPGMYLTDPFHVAEAVVSISIDGIPDLGGGKGHHFPMRTNTNDDDTFYALKRRIEDRNPTGGSIVADINLSDGLEAITDYEFLHEIKHIKRPKGALSYLKLSVEEDRNFLQEINLLNAIADKINSGVIKRDHHPDYFRIKCVGLHAISDLYGENSTEIKEAKQLLTEAIGRINEAFNQVYQGDVLVTIVSSDASHTRRARSANEPEKRTTLRDDSDLNLAQTYDSNYPVIFNIILWFGVVMVFSLLAISLVIGNMDPGRDSIIYRMTSTRMKKDN